MQLGFGSGILVGTPTFDFNGNAIANPTPTRFGVLQDVSIDMSFDLKELFGGYTAPVAIAQGKTKISGKAKFAQLNGTMLNSIVFGAAYTNLQTGFVNDTTGAAVPASTPWQITPTVPGSGTWLMDAGVNYAGGRPLQRVVSAPIAGQYSVAAGVYTFAVADAGTLVFINFEYTATSTIAKKITLPNRLMGPAPQFRADLLIPYGASQFVFTLGACSTAKFSFATKMDDFMMPELDFMAFADPLGNIAYLSMAE